MTMRPRNKKVAVITLSALSVMCCFYLYLQSSPFESKPLSEFVPSSPYVFGRIKLEANSRNSTADKIPLRQRAPTKPFAERRQHYIDACATAPAVANYRLNKHNKASFWEGGGLAYCNIPKCGSTTLKKIFYYLHKKFTGSFFKKRYGNIHTVSRAKPARTLQGKDVTSVVFVREPYARLLSGYMDKIFKPSYKSWGMYARPVVRLLSNDSRHDVCSAARVTFRQFVRYFLKTEGGRGRRNPHFLPMSQQCGFCTGLPKRDNDSYLTYTKLRAHKKKDPSVAEPEGPEAWRSGFIYDVIGKLEDVTDDVNAILDGKEGVRDKLPADFELHNGSLRQQVSRFVKGAFSQGPALKCMSREEMLRRMWTGLQARGRLSMADAFPAEVLARSLRRKQETGEGSQSQSSNHSRSLRESQEEKKTDSDVSSSTSSLSEKEEEREEEREERDRFLSIALSAFDRTITNPDSVRNNRKLAMAEAYSSIPLEERRDLQRVLERDFQLFDYPSSIPEVFPEGDEFPSSDFTFFKQYAEDK